MSTYAFSIASNTPGAPTGYGVQAMLLAERLLREGHDVAAFSNYGLEGQLSTIATPYGEMKHYPRGVTLYSGDVLKPHHEHFIAKRDIPNAIITLYDAWVFNEIKGLDDLRFWSWTPVDHLTLPPKVLEWAKRDNVTTIAMSPFGKRAFGAMGIESHYIPHAIDTSVYKPTPKIEGYDAREYFGLKDDDFLVGMVAANKANGSIHRKAFAENFMAFALFLQDHPDAYLYVHSDPTKVYGGFNLIHLAKAVGIPEDRLILPDPTKLRYSYTSEQMAGIYSTMNVLLHASYGEGFGVPAIEAQACGTRVIGSNWCATPELLGEDSWLVDGQPFWDEAQMSFFNIPLVPSLVSALRLAYEAPRGTSKTSIEFAQQFDADTVFETYWKPFIEAQI